MSFTTAIKCGNLEVLKKLIEHDPSVFQNEQRCWGFYIYALVNNMSIKSLVSANVNINAKDHSGLTVFMMLFVFDLILADPDTSSRLNELISAGAQIDATDNEGNTALMVFCKVGNYKPVEFLLKCDDVDIYARNHRNLTAMHICCLENNEIL